MAFKVDIPECKSILDGALYMHTVPDYQIKDTVKNGTKY